MEELAIKIEHVSKQYRLGAIGGGTLKGDLQSWWARKRGREDPNSKIGERTDVKIGERFLALDDINLEVKKGEALGIIGHNGAGKSTLLKLLSRVTAPTTGKISYNGRITSMLEVGTGFHPELTGRENIYMNGAILGLTKAEIDAKMEDIIEFSEVRQFIDTPVKRYSSGMYVKLAFSVAAHLDSEIMIMDEVLAVGDSRFQQKCLQKMRKVAEDGRTVLYVSHNMSTIRQLCDRCIVLSKGKKIFDGEVEKAIELYVGSIGSIQNKYIYSDEAHRHLQLHDSFYMEQLDIINHLSSGKKLNMELSCHSKVAREEVFFRFEIQYQDGHTVGTAVSSHGIPFSAGERKTISLEFSRAPLAPGSYSVNIIAFVLHKDGSQVFLDGVYPGFITEILHENVTIDNQRQLTWRVQDWGNVRFPDIMIHD